MARLPLESGFFLVMIISSAVTLVRGFLVAAVVPVDDFARYATIVAVGSFASILLSVGRVEASFKTFPRLWVEGRGPEIAARADRTASLMLLRTAFAAALIVVVALLSGYEELLPSILAAAAFAFAVAAIGNYISALRATGDLSALGSNTLARAILTAMFAVVGALLAGWAGSVLGEILGALSATVLARQMFLSATCKPAMALGSDLEAAPASNQSEQGLWLFGAALVNAVVLYLDRPFATWYAGTEAAGGYAFLMLFKLGAATVVGILAQSAGPMVIRLAAQGEPRSALMRHLSPRIAFSVVLFLTGLFIAGVALLIAPLETLGTRYSITLHQMVAVTILCVLQVATFLDWPLMAVDRDRSVFLASVANLAAGIVGAGLIILLGADIVWIIWALAASQAVQILVKLAALARMA